MLMILALPASAHHVNSCDFSKQYYSITGYVYGSGECHCRSDDGYRVRLRSYTDGFGFLDSSGAKGMIVRTLDGVDHGVRWNPTEMDNRAHQWQTNYNIITYWRFEHYYVWTGGNMKIILDCGRGSTGTSSWVS